MPANDRTFRDGLTVGLIAYAAVALFYSAFDLLAARGTLFTLDMLGKAMFRGVRDPSVLQFPDQLDVSSIFWYNGLHLVASLAIGLIVVSLVAYGERHRSRLALVMLMIVAGGVVTVLAIGAMTQDMRPVLPWWSITVANVLASLLAGAYLLRKHPILRHFDQWRDSPTAVPAGR